MNAPGRVHEPRRRVLRRLGCCAGHGTIVGVSARHISRVRRRSTVNDQRGRKAPSRRCRGRAACRQQPRPPADLLTGSRQRLPDDKPSTRRAICDRDAPFREERRLSHGPGGSRVVPDAQFGHRVEKDRVRHQHQRFRG